MNLLDNWLEKTKALAWRNALQNIPPYSEINRIYKVLSSFVPVNQLQILNDYSDHNPLTRILINYDVVSIYQLLDIALLIEYYQSHPNNESISLKNNKGQVNFNEFEDRLFELYINKILNDNSLETRIDKSYFLESGIKKPIDSVLNYRDKEYLIECKKIGLEKSKLFEKLVSKLISSINRFKNDLHISEVFKGYIGIKKQSYTSKDIHELINSFDNLIKAYFREFRNNKDNILKIEHEIENDIFKIYILPAYYDKKIDSEFLKTKFFHHISFNSSNFDYAKSLFKLDISISLNHNNLKTQLMDKIEKKINQHKKADIDDQIIVLGFESVIRDNQLEGRIPELERIIKKMNFDFIDNKKISILFLIKTYSSQKPRLEIKLAYNDNFDPNLKDTLLSLQNKWH